MAIIHMLHFVVYYCATIAIDRKDFNNHFRPFNGLLKNIRRRFNFMNEVSIRLNFMVYLHYLQHIDLTQFAFTNFLNTIT